MMAKIRKASYCFSVSLLILIGFLFFSAGKALAQEKKVALGLGFSPTLNWLKAGSDGLDGDGSKIGYTYGLVADFNFGENYAFATGLYINSGGGKLKSVEIIDSVQRTVKTNYTIQTVMIPITLRMRTKEIGYLKYFGQFGFNPELVINANADIDVDGVGSRDNVGVMSEVVDMNLSLVLGIGIEYNLSGTTNFIIGLSYHNGFVDMLKGSAGASNASEKKATTNQIALNLGVLF